MKKFNKNIIVFVFSFVFIGLGFGRGFIVEMGRAARDLVIEMREGGSDSISNFTERVDEGSSKQLSYHDLLMDIDSKKQYILNTRIVNKDSDTIVKTDLETLVVLRNNTSDEYITEVVSKIDQLHQAATENGAEFLYVAAPVKGYGFALPENVTDYITSNYDRFVEELAAQNIPTLDLTAELMAEGKYNEDIFFQTDHHWKPEIGFWAAGEICRSLNTKYGFEFNSQYTDLENYEVKTYQDWFLGSYGKKVGTYFTAGGADDIDLITPKFDTDLTEEQPFKNQVRTGSFTDTVLYMDNISTRDYYGKNPYAAYSGGDFRLQIVRNNLNTEGKKILLIRDSYACAVAPFLALNAGELHIVDLRDFSYFVGEKINVYEYIQEIDPDYVLVLFSGVANTSGL